MLNNRVLIFLYARDFRDQRIVIQLDLFLRKSGVNLGGGGNQLKGYLSVIGNSLF